MTPTTLDSNPVHRSGKTIFIPLPRELWRRIDYGCSCMYCSATPGKSNPEAYWDTLAVAAEKFDKLGPDVSWTVHAPEFHGAEKKREES